MSPRILASEQVGQFFVESARGRDRIEFTEYGAGDSWVVLVAPLPASRAAHDRLAHALASSGLHVVVPDLLGHGRSDRPADPLAYSVSDFAAQVVGLLDHLGATQAVIGGSGVGANVALEVAVTAPERTRGLILDGPVLDDAFAAGLAVLGPLLYLSRFAPIGVHAARVAAKVATAPVPRRLLPGRVSDAVDRLDQRPGPMTAVVHGVLFGRLAPSVTERSAIGVPALVIAHPADALHRASDAEALVAELPAGRAERMSRRGEWRRAPERLDLAVTRFVLDCSKRPVRAARRRG